MKWLAVQKVDFIFERIANGACRNGNGYLSGNHSLSGHLSHITPPSLPKPQRLGMVVSQVYDIVGHPGEIILPSGAT